MFEGKFYNGRTSKGMPAFITLEPNHIHIVWQTDAESGTEVWLLPDIHQLEFNDATTVLEYGKFPRQSIAVFEQGFRQALEQQYRGAKFLSSKYNSFLKTGVKGLVLGGLCLLTVAVVLFFWGVPALAEKAAAHFPEDYEHAMGESLYNRVLEGYTVDSAKTVALQAYLDALQVQSDFPIRVTVVENEVVNAFAMPGGFILVHDAILDKMEHHEELAGLLGHEIGHVQMRHSTKAMARSLSHYMLLSVLFGDASGISAVIIDNASSLYSLEYSRKAETDSDKAGLRLLAQNRLDPKGMVWLMERLNSDEPEFLKFVSTHPRTDDRITALNAHIKENKYKTAPNPALEAAWAELKGE
ncbi:M48 family metallopeptidase [Pontibacter anaerobius]|uniref:M48 family metallopeptidase n=1 Tax=Pontibacter anaerobius TaxID=2993940 RepID=A0ABT3RAI4_9BACT|nr:M48 family metallopeptidase [Pontibacter anaerobius]MCX2738866.1 M48 family metallopeptidase [Pontibacter anaerobius]